MTAKQSMSKTSGISLTMMATLAAGVALPIGRRSRHMGLLQEKPRELTRHDQEALEEARQKRERKAMARLTKQALK